MNEDENPFVGLPADTLVAEYVTIREEIAVLEEAHKEAVGLLKDKQNAVSSCLLAICNEQNADGFKTANGTVTRSIKSRYWTNDWESMYRFISQHDAPYLLEQRIHNGHMKQFLEECPDDFPPGLQADRSFTITVRRPSAR